MATRRRTRTPAQCIAAIVRAAMADTGMSAASLAAKSMCSENTVYNDLKKPENMDLGRMQLYFVNLGIPLDECLGAFAEAYARHLVLGQLDN